MYASVMECPHLAPPTNKRYSRIANTFLRIITNAASKGRGAPCETTAINKYCPTVFVDVLLQLVPFLKEGGGRICHCKVIHSAKPINAKKMKNPLRGSTFYAAALRQASHWITRLGQSLWDPHYLMIGGKTRGELPGSDCSVVWRGGAEVSSTRR